MTPPDLTFELTELRDDAMPQRDRSIERSKVAIFYLGKFGPFTERFPLSEWSDSALLQRVTLLKQHLTNLHR